MTKSRIEHVEEQLSALRHDMGDVKIAVELIREKQGNQLKRHESIKASFHHYRERIQEGFNQVEKRLHKLEDFVLSYVERSAMVKGSTRFWPALLMALLFAFCVGIFVDDQKVATEIANQVELKG